MFEGLALKQRHSQGAAHTVYAATSHGIHPKNWASYASVLKSVVSIITVALPLSAGCMMTLSFGELRFHHFVLFNMVSVGLWTSHNFRILTAKLFCFALNWYFNLVNLPKGITKP